MRCAHPDCDAWTRVLETREMAEGTLMRRMRVCANAHKFPTFEIPGNFYSRVRGTLKRSVDGRVKTRRRAVRDAEIRRMLDEGRSTQEIADRFKMHVTRVRQIKKGRR